MKRILSILLAALCLASCGGGSSRRKAADTASDAPRVFLPALAPARMSPDEQRDYLRWHYWDNFDFSDTLFLARADTLQLVEAYVRYVAEELAALRNISVEEAARITTENGRRLFHI